MLCQIMLGYVSLGHVRPGYDSLGQVSTG